MRVSMRVRGGGRAPGEQEKELATYLNGQQRLRGRVHLIAERRQSGGMSQSVATVLVELGPVAVVFAAALIGWIRHRTSDTRVTVRRPDGAEFEVSAQRVRGLGQTELRTLVEQVAQAVNDGGPPAAPSPNAQNDGPARAEPEALPPDGAGTEPTLAELLGTEEPTPGA
ncbi:effector-associated constant component EACC1 [Nonomuraea sp. SYSU D8015]|uniref:effector-associated constant component EACC1 n=1 Tax=Nonomuraea sp. SYSU D8015 TaxID=2593644 RepID=UPI0016616DEB|nr:hypothetical protein [Nonomuraea sp. SYSU D8015]